MLFQVLYVSLTPLPLTCNARMFETQSVPLLRHAPTIRSKVSQNEYGKIFLNLTVIILGSSELSIA